MEKNGLFYLLFKNKAVLLHPQFGMQLSPVEYASGGRVVASSNLVIPTTDKALIIDGLLMLFLLKRE